MYDIWTAYSYMYYKFTWTFTDLAYLNRMKKFNTINLQLLIIYTNLISQLSSF